MFFSKNIKAMRELSRYPDNDLIKAVEIFKTNVTGKRISAKLIKALHHHLPCHKFNFDLQDPDHILRAESNMPNIQTEAIVQLAAIQGIIISLVTE